jgi:hypothetical protein
LQLFRSFELRGARKGPFPNIFSPSTRGRPVALHERMRNQFRALARDATFIPFIYDYCDLWCKRCPLTARCLLFAAEPLRPSGRSAGDERLRLQTALALSTAVIEASSPEQQPVAKLDLAMCDVSTAPREPAIGHPLEFLGHQYGLRADAFLASLTPVLDDYGQPEPTLQLLARYHWLIPAKIYRALVSHYQAADVPELMADALGSAKIALIAIDRSVSEWRSLAARDDDARIEGLVELLQALRTGVELRFPDALAFRRPGLD